MQRGTTGRRELTKALSRVVRRRRQRRQRRRLIPQGGGGGVSQVQTAAAQGRQGSRAGHISGGTAADRSNTREFTSAAADEARVGGRHGARPPVRERDAVRRETCPVSPQEWGTERGAASARP